ncbi:S8 family peptidase [Tabrizicola sp.]|uniref:S8 family peptidase n=1 Tax=Tabrizicola sp. TaxID=2005166 RepID=UPI003F3CEA3C
MPSPMPPHPRRKSSLLLSLSCLALLAACGGGEEGDPLGDFYTITASPGGSGTFGSYFMASITDEWRAAAASFRDNSARFRLQNGTFTVNGSPVFGNPLHSSRVDYAHALGLSGAGQVIAIVDAGFRRTHEAFAGKSITTSGNPGLDEHGTQVASIAAGNSPSMVGVAPGADLVLSNWGNNNFANLAVAADAARLRGAVAQNNSWGFTLAFANQAGYDSIFANSAGQTWLTALENYAVNNGVDSGVVIFAVSNDRNATTAGLMEALPIFEPGLTPGWLAVGNAIPIFDDNGVNGAQRVSAPCLGAAAWCLMADGYWVSASDTSNTAYAEGTGSSFAAPQVAGALALLAEAFPNLTPHQLRARILASADNTFTGFSNAGTGVVDVDPGAGVFNHEYSLEFGHGFLDIRAALLPIGVTTLATADGGKITTEDFGFSTGGAMGDAVTSSLEGINLTVTDQLAGGFNVAAKSFASAAEPEPLAVAVAARAFSKDYEVERTKMLNPLAETFASHPGATLELNGPDGRTRAAVLVSGGDSYGVAVSRTLTDGDFKVDVGVKLARDNGSLMGFSDGNGAGGAEMAALTLGLSHDVGNGGFFALSGEIGVADLGAPAAMSAVSSANFNSVGLDIGSRSVFAKGDRLALGVSMPIAVTSGSAEMMVPVSLGEGRTEMRSVGIDLAPEERQMDISISYQVPMGDNSEMMFEVVHADNYGNRAGMSDSAAVIGMKWSF